MRYFYLKNAKNRRALGDPPPHPLPPVDGGFSPDRAPMARQTPDGLRIRPRPPPTSSLIEKSHEWNSCQNDVSYL